MLPRAEAPARQLPYTTADMSERLAKRKAEQKAEEFKVNAFNKLANFKPKEDKPWYADLGNAVVDAAGYVYDRLPQSNPISTPINMGGNAGVSMGGQGTGKSLVTEPARLALRRAVGDITAIPRVGKDSPSYTADQIREQGVARGVLGAAIDYSQFIPFVAKGAGFTGDAVNAYKLAMMERQANPFPALRGASNVIDVAPGSRLPARIVEAPAPPTTRLAEAQTSRVLPPAATRALPPAPEPPPSRLTPPAFRERQVPTSSRLTVETNVPKNFDGTPLPNGRQQIIIRSFDQQTGKYTGALTITYNPYTKKATVDGLGATNPMVTPQLISAAATEVRKLNPGVQFPLVPSSSLSAHSRPFVERLQQAGLVDPNYQLPAIESINDITKMSGPEDFASANSANQVVLDPFSYQPTYNDVLRALVESKRQAKLQGEYGRLTTPSAKLAPERNSLINEDEILSSDEFNPSYAFDPIAVIERPVRIAEFIRNNVDPNNPLLRYYLNQYGSIENFATSNESFSMMSFMRPFYGQEPL